MHVRADAWASHFTFNTNSPVRSLPLSQKFNTLADERWMANRINARRDPQFLGLIRRHIHPCLPRSGSLESQKLKISGHLSAHSSFKAKISCQMRSFCSLTTLDAGSSISGDQK